MLRDTSVLRLRLSQQKNNGQRTSKSQRRTVFADACSVPKERYPEAQIAKPTKDMPRFALNGINDDTVVVCARATAFQILRRVCAAPRCSFQVQLLGLLESSAGDDLDVCASYVYGWHRLMHNSLIARTTATITCLVEKELLDLQTHSITVHFQKCDKLLRS